jgi:hypothetical protein
VAEEAVRAKLEQPEDKPAGQAAETFRKDEPVRRAVVQATGKPTVRMLHEESFLAINLMYPGCRASLDDLSAVRFSSDERKAAFELLAKHREASGAEIAGRPASWGRSFRSFYWYVSRSFRRPMS